MADELRREIQVLTAENEELRQLVQLLQENNSLKATLRTQEAVSMGGSSVGSQLYESGSGSDSSSLDGGTFRLPLRLPLTSSPQVGTPPPPMTPVGAAPIFQFPSSPHTPLSPHTPPPQQMFTPSPGGPMMTPPRAPRGQRMQQVPGSPLAPPPVMRLNVHSPRLRLPGTPDSGMQGVGASFVSPDLSGQEFSFRSGSSSPGRLRGRGYCAECAVPYHPHIQQHSLADSVLSGRMNASANMSDDASFG